MKEIPAAPPLPNAPPAQGFSKLGFVYITVMGLADQVVPHTGSWRPLATAVNYLVQIAPIVYMAFQARSASPVGVQLGSSIGRENNNQALPLTLLHFLALVFLLSYLGAYFLLGRFNLLLGRYCLLGELLNMRMISVPIGTLVTGLNPSAAIHLLGGMFSSRWVPGMIATLESFMVNFSRKAALNISQFLL
ncbi:hypothetical protein DSO57_1003285 [Entomophthora muscae]|uniref:Uncharacterized protein n=1 Tax=Entomophthora muscae TaxID=34485 RepID=A0ACC2T894_9FUNG|nr:hypothetical protein DSO57_1003285 [Entomophthora muscae]